MIFGEVRLEAATGAYLAHSLKAGARRIKKGCLLTPELIEQLRDSGYQVVTVARLEADDVFEDEAALCLAKALAGSGVRIGKARTGRVNLHAMSDGICEFDRTLIERANSVDEGITVATVEPGLAVGRGRLLATIKIIPYGVSQQSLDAVLAGLGGQLQLHAVRSHTAVLIQTCLPTLKSSVLDKTYDVTQQRLLVHQCELLTQWRTAHTVDAVVVALTKALQSGADWLLLVGASAVADRNDVIPAAIERVGGHVLHFGMAMDPGNLLLLASIDDKWVIGMPGCARSPRPNGLDRVLGRLSCGLPVHRRWFASIGVGGLLHEIVDRPAPRVPAASTANPLHVSALILAAGSSSRFGQANKLLADTGSGAVLARVLSAVQSSNVTDALLVSGHESQQIDRLCEQAWLCVKPALMTVHNPLHRSGMASSLVCGIAELSDRGVDAALVCLGDMPKVSSAVMDALISAFQVHPNRSLYIPTFKGQRGNPVLIAASLFDSVLVLEGDVGARVLAKHFPESVMEVAVTEPGILFDIDSPTDLPQVKLAIELSKRPLGVLIMNRRMASKSTSVHRLLLPLLICGVLSSVQAAEIPLRLMQTSDLHMHAMNFDYYRNTDVDDFGLSRTATLIRDARAEVRNSLLFDNGDLIQGNPMGDYMARSRGLAFGEIHPMYKAMNLLGYDAANVGNHEFNYGLEFLLKSLSGANFPYVLANVFAADGDDDPSNDRPYIQPYVLLERRLLDTDGQWHDLTIGVIGFTPPQIMTWDKGHLDGQVTVRGIVETAEELVPQMREAGADIVVAIAHSGIATVHPDGLKENATAELAQVSGIDAILFGHAHNVFPSEAYEGFPGADLDKGTLHGVPSVMPGFWGNHLGLIDLSLSHEGDQWRVVDSHVENRAIFRREGRENIAVVGSQQDIIDAVSNEHEGTVEWVGQPVGSILSPINSFFALVQDDPSIQIVNNAQAWYGEQVIEGTEYEGLPVLSAGAPFKAGGRGGPDYFTNLPAGEIAIRNVADLYIYPNTVRLVKLSGAQISEWLERSAAQFNMIDPSASEPQTLISDTHPSYNFDVIDGVSYRIDVTQPARYGDKGELLDESARRIVDLTFEGAPIDPSQEFVVVTNNYRAGGGGSFPALDGSTVIVEAPQTNRQVLVDYILESGELDPKADNNWAFAPINADVEVVFDTSPSASEASNAEPFEFLDVLESGFARYKISMGE